MSKKSGFSPYDNYRNRPQPNPEPATSDFGRPAASANSRPVSSITVDHTAKVLPEEYVDLAEKNISDLKAEIDADRRIKPITTTKLRNLFNLFAEVYNESLRMEGDKLTAAQIDALRTARVRIVYECGRDRDVKRFVDKTEMREFLFGVEDRKSELIRYYHYLEALVAYGRFTGYTKDEK
ncbi:MAG: type III-A CRISPR-associated protein Csm2 [Clostridia bacterium]|nr:type III-A CRISPR-associated protein Csm2 [Clostridia bacterium]